MSNGLAFCIRVHIRRRACHPLLSSMSSRLAVLIVPVVYRPRRHPPVACNADLPLSVNRLTLKGMQLDLTDDETAALERLLSDAIDRDRYPLSPRIKSLKGVLAKIRPEPTREPLPPLKQYEPPRAGRYRRR